MASTSDELFDAIEAGEAERVRELLRATPSLATARDPEGVSALLRARYRNHRAAVDAILDHVEELDVFEAAALGDVQRLRVLLDADPGSIGVRSADGFTPLHLAAFFGGAASVEFLLDRGAPVDERGAGWMTGTALHSACAARDQRSAELLLGAGADPNARQSGGFTSLHAAAQHGDVAIARALVEAGADPASVADDGTSVLGFAERSGNAETVALMREWLEV